MKPLTRPTAPLLRRLPARPLQSLKTSKFRQGGVAAVELALIMVFAFLPLLLGILEFGRLFYVADTVHEVTRRAARDQVVRWSSQTSAIQRDAVFQCGDSLTGATLSCGSTGAVNLPAGLEVTNTSVVLGFYHSYANALSNSNAITGIASPQDNMNTCLRDITDPNCILFVRATLQGSGGGALNYSPMLPWFWNGAVTFPLPAATVIMPAEALGLL